MVAPMNSHKVTQCDRKILRDLAKRKLEAAHDPVMDERRSVWLRHNSLEDERPVILAETGGVLDEVIPTSCLECKEDWARALERRLRTEIFQYESVTDDTVVEPFINCSWHVKVSDFGVPVVKRRADNEGRLGSYTWDPPIKDLDRDFDKLHPRTYSVDRESTFRWKDLLEDIFGDILTVRIRGQFWWTTGLTWTAIDLIGLENLMVFMYDNPEGLHRLMAFLRDDMLAFAHWLQEENLLTLNNENDYVGSGSLGYTTELPLPDGNEEGVRLKDLWVLSESQETVGVSPEMFAEFIFPYQLSIVERFGLSYYGCCEPVHARLDVLKTIPNLRKVSVSPWCDQEIAAKKLGRDYIFCRKPNPTLISREHFEEEEIRADLEKTLAIAGNCHLELVMKDVHTVCRQPWRLGSWVEIARQVCSEMM